MLKTLKRPSPDREKKVRKPKAKDFIEKGTGWDADVNGRLRASRNLAWMVAGIAGAIAALALICLALLIPLKETELLTVSVDQQTGYVEVVRSIDTGLLTQDEAVTLSNLVRYITARETYDPQDIEENYYEVVSMSKDKALSDYVFLWDGSANPDDTPSEAYGFDVEREVEIKNISMLNDYTAQVRFYVVHTQPSVRRVEHKVAVLTFEYVQRPETLRDRFQNPLGFKVSQYRVDEELTGEN